MLSMLIPKNIEMFVQGREFDLQIGDSETARGKFLEAAGSIDRHGRKHGTLRFVYRLDENTITEASISFEDVVIDKHGKVSYYKDQENPWCFTNFPKESTSIFDSSLRWPSGQYKELDNFLQVGGTV